MEGFTLHGQPQDAGLPGWGLDAARLRETLTRGADDLQRPDGPAEVVGVDALGRDGVKGADAPTLSARS